MSIAARLIQLFAVPDGFMYMVLRNSQQGFDVCQRRGKQWGQDCEDQAPAHGVPKKGMWRASVGRVQALCHNSTLHPRHTGDMTARHLPPHTRMALGPAAARRPPALRPLSYSCAPFHALAVRSSRKLWKRCAVQRLHAHSDRGCLVTDDDFILALHQHNM